MREKAGLSGHGILGMAAFHTLPSWERDIFEKNVDPRKPHHPCFSEGIRTVAEKAGEMCRILDWVYYEEFRPYAVMPDGRWIPHSPPDEKGQSSSGSGRPRSGTVFLEMIEWLFSRAVRAAEEKNWEEALRMNGALGHFIQEPFTPGHAVDNSLFHQFFPDPDTGRHIRLHHKFDAATGEFTPRPPVLMGTSVSEASFRILIEIEKGIRGALKLCGALIRSAYAGEPQEKRQVLLAGQSRDAAFLTASAWHTVLSIAFKRFKDEELDLLRDIDLTAVSPFFVHHAEYADILPGSLVRDERMIPINVFGKYGEERVEKGFGMTGHMGIKFFVNGDVFPRFKCRVGLPSRQGKGQTENTDVVFSVEKDSGENLTYSEDMEYNAEKIFSVRLKPGEPVKDADVSIEGARTLILSARSKPYKDAGGRINFDIPHIAVCEPVLLKR